MALGAIGIEEKIYRFCLAPIRGSMLFVVGADRTTPTGCVRAKEQETTGFVIGAVNADILSMNRKNIRTEEDVKTILKAAEQVPGGRFITEQDARRYSEWLRSALPEYAEWRLAIKGAQTSTEYNTLAASKTYA